MGISRGASKLIASTLDGSGPRRRAITFGVQRVETDDGGSVLQDEQFGRLGFGSVESIDYYFGGYSFHEAGSDLGQRTTVQAR